MYTLADAATLLNAGQSTLRRWIARAKIKTIQVDADLRYRYLRPEDVQRLAREHHRVVAHSDVGKLAMEIAELKRKVEELGK